MAEKLITSEVLVAYSQCPRKAFFLLFSDYEDRPHDHTQVLTKRRAANRLKYVKAFQKMHENAKKYNGKNLRNGELLTEVILKTDFWEAYCDILEKVDQDSLSKKAKYEPTIVVGTYSITKEQKTELLFVGIVLERIQQHLPVLGNIVGMDGKAHRLKLGNSYKSITPFLKTLKSWTEEKPAEAPPLILNKNCLSCQFQHLCREQAVKEDNLSLLDRMTPKAIQKYNARGIFTVHQLSYLFKSRRNKKHKRKAPIKHRLELQALAVREKKVYIQELPHLPRKTVELFLDIEGIPDQNFYYLIGLLICERENKIHYSFWADDVNDEERIWKQLIKRLDEYSDSPIYHYGSYELKAIKELTKKYSPDRKNIARNFINLNLCIYGKIYFSVFSNSLKKIGDFINATWDSPKASGIQSLAWRYNWEDIKDNEFKRTLITYNKQDCEALAILVDKITEIEKTANSNPQIDFVDQSKRYTTENGEEIHKKFDIILKSAHINYEGKKIKLRQNEAKKTINEGRDSDGSKKRRTHRKIVPKARKRIEVPRMLTCPRHLEPLKESRSIAKKTIIDLNFLRSGVKKTVIEYFGKRSRCPKCKRYYRPPEIRKYSGPLVYGRGFQIWVAYHRVALKLPHRVIAKAIEDQFNETISVQTVRAFVHYISHEYADTEKMLFQSLLQSPILHVDETTVEIQKETWYVWVFTDNQSVAFKLTRTREIENVAEILSNYSGVLISDFYPGYDSLNCNQQKCWVHLIRDLNEDLWKYPHNAEFETFIVNLKNLILPIFETVEEYGLKRKRIQKYKKKVDQFYDSYIIHATYQSDLVIRYQKRFKRYRESLFTFLEGNNIPWHNNVAENAIRHFARQRDASGSMFETSASDYLRLLGINQSCRFQGKSFLKFLLSSE